MRFIIPNINTKQQEFYSRHVFKEAYEKDVDGYISDYLVRMAICMRVTLESCYFSFN